MDYLDMNLVSNMKDLQQENHETKETERKA